MDTRMQLTCTAIDDNDLICNRRHANTKKALKEHKSRHHLNDTYLKMVGDWETRKFRCACGRAYITKREHNRHLKSCDPKERGLHILVQNRSQLDPSILVKGMRAMGHLVQDDGGQMPVAPEIIVLERNPGRQKKRAVKAQEKAEKQEAKRKREAAAKMQKMEAEMRMKAEMKKKAEISELRVKYERSVVIGALRMLDPKAFPTELPCQIQVSKQ